MVSAGAGTSQAVELLQLVGVGTGVAGSLAAGLWGLVWPRIEDKLQELAGGMREVTTQLQADVDGTTGAHAATAARAAAQLPELRRIVEHLAGRQAELEELRLPERLQLVELQTENHERRLGSVEQALITSLGSELAAARRRQEERNTG